jgi:hypothetical protein
MKLYYTIFHALSELKRQIKENENILKKEKAYYKRLSLLSSMEWLFERGVSLINSCKPKERADLLAYFQDKSGIRKDIRKEIDSLEDKLIKSKRGR